MVSVSTIWIYLSGAIHTVTGVIYECPTSASFIDKFFDGNPSPLGANQILSTENNTNCFLFLRDRKRDWTDARQACDKLVSIVPNLVGSPVHLAIVNTTEKQAVIEEKLQKLYREGSFPGGDRFFMAGRSIVDFNTINTQSFNNLLSDSPSPKWRIFSDCKTCTEMIGEQTNGLRNGLLGTQGCYWGDPYESNTKYWVRNLLPENVTLEACEEKCQEGGYPYFSLRTLKPTNGPEESRCYCINSDVWYQDPDGLAPTHDTVTGTNNGDSFYCNEPCTGDSTQRCGGYARYIFAKNVFPETIGVVGGISSPASLGDSLWSSQEPNYFMRNQDCAVVDLRTNKLRDEFCFTTLNGGPFPYICETDFRSGSTTRCRNGHYKVAGTCLFMSAEDEAVNWYEARQKCKDLGGDLWFPRDIEGNVERLKTLSGRPTDDTKNSKYYVGAVSRAWFWSNTEPMSFTNFESNQPTGGDYKIPRCLLMYANPFESSFQWKDTPCSAQFFTMCELEIEEDTVNQCDSNPCQNGGTCKDGIQRFTCDCITGYEGLMCETNINECASNPCANNAACVDEVNGFKCNCVAGYAGISCAVNVNECNSGPCQNGGSCDDAVNGYTCRCLPGFEGNNCQTNIDECTLRPCLNNGVCTDGVNTRTCACPPGFAGDNCIDNLNECLPNPCQNTGRCLDGINDYTCECYPPKWGGKNCDVDLSVCPANACSGRGICRVPDPSLPRVCECVSGYTGTECETNINDCDPNPCQNDATCTDITEFPNRYSCECKPGFQGVNCENVVDPCQAYQCQNDANCVEDPSEATGRLCQCKDGYTGVNCQTNINECDSNPCQNDGTCRDGIGRFTCECPTDYTGGSCQTNTNECRSSPCQNGGTCIDGADSYACECPSNYTGTNCQTQGTDPSLGASTNEDSGLGTFEIALIIILVILVLAIIIAVIIFCCYKKKEGPHRGIGVYDVRNKARHPHDGPLGDIIYPTKGPENGSAAGLLVADQNAYSSATPPPSRSYQGPNPRISINDYY